MFVNKIIGNGIKNQQVFKGYQHKVSDVGQDVMRFNYPADTKNDNYTIEFYKVEEDKKSKNGYKPIETPVHNVKLAQDGVDVIIDNINELRGEKAFAYRIVKNGSEKYADVGAQTNGFTIVSRRGTTPLVQGPGILIMPDSHRPGAYYDKETGKVNYDINIQKNAEKINRNFTNRMGGNLAGIEYDLDDLKSANGPKILEDAKVIFATPIAGGDDRSAFRYWNQNNMQIDSKMGSVENYNSVVKKMFQNGKKVVFDGTFTSEGVEGIHFQYALKWHDRPNYAYYLFKMNGIKNGPIGLGVIPKNYENLRHIVINPPSLYDDAMEEVIPNPKYDSSKETYLQIYDAKQVTKEQLDRAVIEGKPLDTYTKATEKPLDINFHDDTIVNYLLEVFDPRDYTKRLEELIKYNKKLDEPLTLDSPEGTRFICQMPGYELIPKTEGGIVTWDANPDLNKVNYYLSGYDEKVLDGIPDDDTRDRERELMQRGNFMAKDMVLQAVKYWTEKNNIVQTIYTAKTLQGADSKKAIDKLIADGKLPKEAELSEKAIENIIYGAYRTKPRNENKDEFMIKSLMSLPLDTLEFAKNTVGVLSSPYFTNRAVTEKTIGMDRYELRKAGEPHLLEEYADNYSKMNLIYEDELKDFADQVIEKVNETSDEKILDDDGNYTLFGQYVVELFAQDIAKYAFLKSLSGENFKSYLWEDGTLSYDYDKIRENTSLKSIGVWAYDPNTEARQVREFIKEGLNTLNADDIETVAKSISQRIAGANEDSFALAEAIVNKAGLGLDWRLDAAKDVVDMDSVRNGETVFDDAWDQVIDFWGDVTKAVKEINPHSYIVAEITDIEDLMKSTYGANSKPYSGIPNAKKYHDADEVLKQFFLKTGVTSEAGYSAAFTDLYKVFSPELDMGYTSSIKGFIDHYSKMYGKFGSDYIRNLWTFADNHDKPSVMHIMALDRHIFNTNLQGDLYNENPEQQQAKRDIMQLVTGADNYSDVPLEARLNIFNNNYYRHISPKAVAMSKLMRDCIDRVLPGVVDSNQIQLLKQATVDLANGNYLGDGNNFKLALSAVPALSDLRVALSETLQTADIYLPSQRFEAIIKSANQKIDSYQVHDDMNNEQNRKRVSLFLSGENADENEYLNDDKSLMECSLYTAAIAGILREALYESGSVDQAMGKKFFKAQKSFMEKYNNQLVGNLQTKLILGEDLLPKSKKEGYASRDFEQVIKMIINQAEYIGHKNGQLAPEQHIDKQDEILKRVFRASTEPAVRKAVTYASVLSAIPGIPTTYHRDLLGALGYDEKAKNIWLQNRNTMVFSQLEDGPLKDYRWQILNMFKDAMNIRTSAGDVLNHGTPYYAKTDNDKIPAMLVQDSEGNAAISLFDIVEGNHGNTQSPCFPNSSINFIELAENLALPTGMIFKNINPNDAAEYIVKKVGNAYRIVNNNKGTIVFNNATSKNGVMILRHTFKGKSRDLNQKYHIVSNPYSTPKISEEGKKLSIIAK